MLQRVFRDRKDGFYIDVGAMDPVMDSVTKFFYDEGWSGINIEPNEWFYSKLLQERPRDINLNLAIGNRQESRPLYVFEQYGISTFDESNRDRFVEQGFEFKQQTVRVTTLAEVCRMYVRRHIDFLKIDCEGWEKHVLEGADWDRFRPTVLIIEGTAPSTATPSWGDWEPFLTQRAYYDMVYFDGLNRFYLRQEYGDFRTCFEVPPNVFDEFKSHSTVEAEYAAQNLRKDQNQLLAQINELKEKLTGTEERLASVVDETKRISESLNNRVTELESHAATKLAQIAELNGERDELQKKLYQARLWIGRLSENCSASKRPA